jgi:adenylate cyclase
MSGADASGPAKEIERVWVLRAMPPVAPDAERWDVDQGYLPVDAEGPNERSYPEGRIRRIRRADGSAIYRHTVKRGAGLVREETERAIDAGEFERWWPHTAGRRVRKTRFRVREGGLVWEIDQFHDLPLVMLEVELPDVSSRAALPLWASSLVVREVTEDPRYRNAALAMHGLPSPA